MTSTEDSPALGRRRFLTFLVAAPTLTVAARLGLGADSAHAAPKNGNGGGNSSEPTTPAEPVSETDLGTTYVLRVTAENRMVFESPKADVGQGISTALAMLIAEDLDANLADIDVVIADATGLPRQTVGASDSIRSMWGPARDLAAQARARLVTAAAERWDVDAGTLTTRNSAVFAPDGRSATYGDLAEEAARVTSPAVSTAPKPVSAHTLVGTPVPQQEGRALVTGAATFALDVAVAGALPAVVARPPTLKGTVVSFDATAARAMPGVVAVTAIPTGIAVVAETFWEAQRARDVLHVTWGSGPVDALSDDKVTERLRQAALPLLDPPLLTNYVDGIFDFGFVNHAPMETLSATADVRGGSATVWCSAKGPNGVRTAVANAIGFDKSAVTVHGTRGGGSFGRRLYSEAPVEAARISKAVGKPVKLLWTRDDDMRHGRMRPASHHKMRITYGLGKPLTFTNNSSAVQLDLGILPFTTLIDPGFGGLPSIGSAFFALTQHTPYDLGVEEKLLNEVPLDFPTGAWRSVYSGHNRAAEEIMIDELAKRLNKDPLALRIELAKSSAAKALLQRLRTVGGWGRAMPTGSAQGVGYQEEYGARTGCLVEIDTTTSNAPRVTKAVVVADMGQVVNPSGLEAQFMGCVMDGISTILYAGNHIDNGAVRESSFADFRWARQGQAPLEFEAHLMPSTGSPGGAGELVIPAAAGAVANAYARATGRVHRRFPIHP